MDNSVVIALKPWILFFFENYIKIHINIFDNLNVNKLKL